MTAVAPRPGRSPSGAATGAPPAANRRTGLSTAVFVIAAITGVVLAARIARGGPLLSARWRLGAELAVWAAAWIVALLAAFRLPRRAALPLILVAAAALRVAALAGPPTTTDDFYRYSWDGRVQEAGINPYRHAPASPALAHLREPWLWPEDRPCPLAYRPKHCTRINRPPARTIYPPVAEAWFAGIYRLTGIEARWKPWQVAGLLTETAVLALLVVGLRRAGRDPRWCGLYALCPAPVLEIVNNGHVDGLAIAFGLGALITGRRREVTAGILAGLAVLVKLFPALLLLALVAASDNRRRTLVRSGGAAAAVVAAAYLPHVLQVGTRVLGYLPGYLREEQYDAGGRYLIAGGLGLPGGLAAVASALALVAAAVWVWSRRPPAATGAAVLLGVLLLAASPVQPWYAVTLLAVATLAVAPEWAVVVAAGYPYFIALILLHPQRVGIGQLSYGLAALAVTARSMRRCPPNGC